MSTKEKIDEMIKDGFVFNQVHLPRGDIEFTITKKLSWVTFGDRGLITADDLKALDRGEYVAAMELTMDMILKRSEFEINYWKNKIKK